MIEGVQISPRAVHRDERGAVLKILRASDPEFVAFGEAYVSEVAPHVIKGWKLHSTCGANVSVPWGKIRFVLHDLREASATHGETMEIALAPTPDDHFLLSIPSGVAYAFQNLSDATSLVLNVATEAWREGEGKNLPLEEIPFTW